MSMLPKWATAVAALGLAGTIVACDGFGLTGPGEGKRQGCRVTFDNTWPTNPAIGRVWVEQPAQCPVRIAITSRVDYGANAELRVSQWSRMINTRFLDKNREVTGFITSPTYVWGSGRGADTLDIASIDGYYIAGQGMRSFDPGTDYAIHEVLRHGTWMVATAHLDYAHGTPGARVEGPSTVLPSESFRLVGYTDDPFLVPPVSYEWRRNGSVISHGREVVWYGSEWAEVHEFQFTVRAADGHSHTQDHRVQAKSCDFQGCNDY